MVNIIGPNGIGKSSINHMISQLDPKFSVPLGFTTRAPRPNEKLKQYRHVPDTAEGWGQLLRKATAGELVQFAIHATSGMIYGTEPQDYKTAYAVLDMQFQLVEKTRQLGFRAIKDIAIVTTPAEYEKQLSQQRRQINNESEMETRRQEGVLCLEWCLSHGDDIAWVHNRYGQLQAAARQVIGIAEGEIQPDTSNRRLGEQLLKMLRDLKPAAG